MKKIMKKILPVLVTLLLLTALVVPASADNIGPTYKDKLDYHYNGAGVISLHLRKGDVPVIGGKYACYLIAKTSNVQPENNDKMEYVHPFDAEFAANPDFALVDETPVALTDEMAQAYAAYIEANPFVGYTYEEKKNETGDLEFHSLVYGLYLIVETQPNPHYEPVRPFLVTVPIWGAITDYTEGWLYEVDASPKMETLTLSPTPVPQPGPTPTPTPGPSETPKKTPPPRGTLPQTGQLKWPVPVLAFGGMVLFAIGWVLRKKQKDTENS